MFEVVFGVVIAVLAGIAWVGQVLAWLAPGNAVRWGLRESPDDVDAVFDADVGGEARWDALSFMERSLR